MFGKLWTFVKRHRRKLIFTGAFVGGVILAGKYARRKLQQLQDEESAECLLAARRQHHFDSNQRTCNITVLTMLPGFKDALMRHLPTEELTELLKQNPSNKIEIWEELKILSLTRSLVAVYSSCMLVAFLHVQLNILGGYMYLDTLSANKDGEPVVTATTSELQHQYMSSVQHLVGGGLLDLIVAVTSAVVKTIGSTPLKQQVSLPAVQKIIDGVRGQVEYRHGTIQASALSCFFLPPEGNTGKQVSSLSASDVFFNKLMKETCDMLESEDFHTVLTCCLDTAFTRLVDRIADYYKPTTQHNGTLLHLNDVTMPLAKLIPILNGLLFTVCTNSPNPLIQEILLKDQLKKFAANIYEAFSQPEETCPITRVKNYENEDCDLKEAS